MPNKSVERRETISVSPSQREIRLQLCGCLSAPYESLRLSDVTRSVNRVMAALSKFTFVSVVKSPSAMRRVASSGYSLRLSAASASSISSQISLSCKLAVSGCLPQTPERTQPEFPAVCWHWKQNILDMIILRNQIFSMGSMLSFENFILARQMSWKNGANKVWC